MQMQIKIIGMLIPHQWRGELFPNFAVTFLILLRISSKQNFKQLLNLAKDLE